MALLPLAAWSEPKVHALVERDVTEVASVAEHGSAASEPVSASAQQTRASTEHIAGDADGLARAASELDELVQRFQPELR